MPSILIADDDPILREIVQVYLDDPANQLTVVEDGKLALRAAMVQRFDLIITDMVMPNLDGIELLQALRTTAPDTPVIGISAGFSGCEPHVLLRAAKAVGAVAVLCKPLEHASFVAAVRDALSRDAAGRPDGLAARA
jgi:two-component system chemotaxis response regulator CheY